MRSSFFGNKNRLFLFVGVFAILVSLVMNVVKNTTFAYAKTDNAPTSSLSSSSFLPVLSTFADTTSSEATCANAAGGLGWVICSTLELLSNALNWIYANVVEPSLVTNVELFSSDSSGGTYQAWSEFRNIANVLFAIYMLVIIFSQLTGIGIDNYGIKKNLPRLIVAGILVNVSYYLCQGLVDLSNIIGSSASSFIAGIKVGDIPAELAGSEIANVFGSTLVTAAIAAAVVGGTIWSFGGVAATGAALAGVLVPLVVGIVGAVVSVLFLALMLGMRQAIVVILVVLSPLAFICYTLPNTKRIFDRWSELLRGMLLLYPICAFIIAAGNMVAKIILSSGGGNTSFWIMLSAMFAEVGPYFLIPGLIRGAYRATGNLGASINNLSHRWSHGAAMRAGRSRNLRELEDERRRTVDINRATRIANRLGSRPTSSLSDSQRRRLGLANIELAKNEEQLASMAYASSSGYLEQRSAGLAERERQQAIRDQLAMISSGATGYEQFGNGNNITEMETSLVELLNRDQKDLSKTDIAKRDALAIQMAHLKGADKRLVEIVHNGSLTDTGLRNLNQVRLQNSDVGTTMGVKGAVTSAYLSDYAGNRVQTDASGNVDWEQYTRTALSDDADLAKQSGGELRRYAQYLDENRIAQFVNSDAYRQIITDDDKRKAIESHPGYRQAVESGEAQARVSASLSARDAQYQAASQEAINRGRVRTKIGGAEEETYEVPVSSGLFTRGGGTWSHDSNGDPVYRENGRVFNGRTAEITHDPDFVGPMPTPDNSDTLNIPH